MANKQKILYMKLNTRISVHTIFGRKYRFITDSLLCKRHYVVYVLWSRHSCFLSLLVKPQVRSEAKI